MKERRRDKGNRAVINQAHAHAAAADINNLSRKAGSGTGLRIQIAGVQPVSDIALRHAVEAAAFSHLYRNIILRTGDRFPFNNRFQQTMVDHIAVLTDRGGPGRIGLKTEAEVRARLGANFCKRLEAANTAVEETGRLRVQLATQLAEAFQRQHFHRVNVHVVRLQ